MLPLIETRGERGFMVAPGSNGLVHPTGGKWELVSGKLTTIATLTADERDLLYDLAASFDETPARKPPPTSSPAGAGLGTESFHDGVDELQRFVVEVVGVEALLVDDGWTLVHTKRDGEQLWRRPGKDRGHSASLFPDGGVNVYTSTIGEAWRDVLLEGDFPFATPLGVLAAVRFGGDIGQAMSHARHALARIDNTAPKAVDVEGHEIDSFAPVDLSAWLDGTFQPIMPDGMLMIEQGREIARGLIYMNRLNDIHGDSGAGKSFAAVFLIKETIEAGKNILLLDLEDGPGPITQRLTQFGVSPELIRRHLTFVHPQEDFNTLNVEKLVEMIRERNIVHTIIDSLGEAFGTEGIDENADVEVTKWIRRVARRIIDATGTGVTWIDHVTKTADNPLHPSGSKRKRAALTGASWYALATKPFTKDAGGRMLFRCGKDRHGNYRQGDTVAELIMEVDALLGYTLRLEGRTTAGEVEGGDAKPKQYEQVITFMVNQERSCSIGAWHTDLKRNGFDIGAGTLKNIVDFGLLVGDLRETAGPRGSRIITAVGAKE